MRFLLFQGYPLEDGLYWAPRMMQLVPEALIRDIWTGVIDQARLIRLSSSVYCRSVLPHSQSKFTGCTPYLVMSCDWTKLRRHTYIVNTCEHLLCFL